MKVKQNEAGEGGSKSKIYSGFTKVKAVLVNPTKEELSEFYGGANISKDQVYVGKTQDGKDQVRINVFVEGEGLDGDVIKTSISFYLTNDFKQTNDGSKWQVINNYGQSGWLEEDQIKSGTIEGSMDWMETKGLRRAYLGEIDLIQFMSNLLNVTGIKKASEKGSLEDAEIYFEDIKKMIAGDVSEIKEQIDNCNNKIGVLLAGKQVEDKVYQYAYNRSFTRGYSNDPKYLVKSFEEWREQGGGSNLVIASPDYSLSEVMSGPDAPSAAPSATVSSVANDDF